MFIDYCWFFRTVLFLFNLQLCSTFIRGKLSNHTLVVHLHKAGGSSLCEAFKHSRFYIGEKGRNCNCEYPDNWKKFWTGSKLNEFLLNQVGPHGACFMERGQDWPPPEIFFKAMRHFNGSLMTVLRDPWERFKSEYQQVYSTNEKKYHSKNFTIKDFAEIRGDPFILYWDTLTNQPNFYVRFFNGLAYGAKKPEIQLNHTHLVKAKEVIKNFNYVLFQDNNHKEREFILSRMTNKKRNMPHVSNNKYSPYWKLAPKYYVPVIPEEFNYTDGYKKTYIEMNRLDYLFYNFTVRYFKNKYTSNHRKKLLKDYI